ncbi:MAG: haloacid dehalogenase [Planctomycetota bacterium]
MPPRTPPPPGQLKLLALDLDGTLLRRDQTVGPRTIRALQAAHARGVKIAFNSGRMAPAMEEPARQVGLDVYQISYNGASVRDLASRGRARLYEQTMPLDVARELALLARSRTLQLNYYLDEHVWCEARTELRPFVELYESRTGSPFRYVERIEEVLDRAPYKVLFVVEPRVRDELLEELEPRYAGRATVTRTDPEYLEFLHPQVDKGVGLRALAARLGLEMSEVMAVGDSFNDTPMLAAAGWGVAVANAATPTREIAAAVTQADCDSDGVAEAIERYLLEP